VSAAGKFEDQFAIQQLPAKTSGKLLPYGGAPTAIFARNCNYPNWFHAMSTIISVLARRNAGLSRGSADTLCSYSLNLFAFLPDIYSSRTPCRGRDTRRKTVLPAGSALRLRRSPRIASVAVKRSQRSHYEMQCFLTSSQCGSGL
jgi:hypothetical protein